MIQNLPPTTPSLSIILPCYNEEDAIDEVLLRLLDFKTEALAEGWLRDLEIIVVDDGSTDRSRIRLLDYDPLIQVIQLPQNRGYGAALKIGFREAQGDLIGFFDLDVTCDPYDIRNLVERLQSEAAEMICGNRLQAESQMPLQRRIGNLLYQTLARLLVDRQIGDCCTGFRIFDSRFRTLFCNSLPDDLDFSLAMTILFLRMGGKYLEAPISYGERRGTSKLKTLREGPKFLITLLKYSASRQVKRLASELPAS